MESGVWGRASEVQGQRWGNGGENKTENRQKEETERGRERQESVNKGSPPLDGSKQLQ